MTSNAAIVICSIISIECIFILIGNIFTICVFWTHRKRLKRASFLLINLAVVDLIVGITIPIGIATKTIPRHLEEDGSVKKTSHDNVSTIFPTMFSCLSLFCLVHISLERAYAVIWPLRHRVATNKCYICSIILVWAAGFSVGAMLLLNLVVKGMSYVYTMAALYFMIFSSLIVICGSYLSIRKRLHCRVPNLHQNKSNNEEQNARFSRTMFIVIAVSFLCWVPASVLSFLYAFCNCVIPMPVFYIGTIFNIASSVVNPVIYSFRMPIFKETLRKFMPRRTSRKFRVNWASSLLWESFYSVYKEYSAVALNVAVKLSVW